MIELRNGASIAAIDVERGGRLASLIVDGRELIVGPPDDGDRTILWGSFLMAPWCGRIDGGVLEWDGQTHQLPVTHDGHAIHGVLWDRAWTIEAAGDDMAVISARFEPGGWPFAGLARQLFELRDGELVTSAELLAQEPMPAALGWHPWFHRTAEDPRLTIHSSHTLETRDLIPTGHRLAVDATTDLRHGTEIGTACSIIATRRCARPPSRSGQVSRSRSRSMSRSRPRCPYPRDVLVHRAPDGVADRDRPRGRRRARHRSRDARRG